MKSIINMSFFESKIVFSNYFIILLFRASFNLLSLSLVIYGARVWQICIAGFQPSLCWFSLIGLCLLRKTT
ncbi:hypothetical protein O6P43_033571 [Quillaja saponaria]|uniref:Uncharacterized protein n=1 Tax=Quillaja saponaria TaxID=32244 RepID=A0AAD7P6V0_QUISA|nr:hypothetical protein O6P43_033571 [Quillaja saponaria]